MRCPHCEQHIRKPEGLTRRERQIAALVARGMPNKLIAHELTITEGTVKVYMSHLMHRIGLKSRLELARYWERECVYE